MGDDRDLSVGDQVWCELPGPQKGLSYHEHFVFGEITELRPGGVTIVTESGREYAFTRTAIVEVLDS